MYRTVWEEENHGPKFSGRRETAFGTVRSRFFQVYWKCCRSRKNTGENNVIFTYEFKLVFYSHIVSFCQRLEAKEKLNVTNSGFEEEVSKEAYGISSKIITMLSEKYGTEADDLEIILAAIQIQLALEFQNQ